MAETRRARMVMLVKDLQKAAQFICKREFWRMAVLWTLYLLISHFQLFVQSLSKHKSNAYPRCKSPLLISTPSKSPVCIITGATSGLGAAAAHALSREGFFVIIEAKNEYLVPLLCPPPPIKGVCFLGASGRSTHLLSKTISEIRKQNEHARVEAFVVDLSSFSSIVKFKASLQQFLLDVDLHPSVQLLINNAGILATSCRNTADGLDEMLATNYIGAFCLTKLLLPLLMDSPVPSRIVNVTSFTHRSVNEMQVDKELISGSFFSNLKQYPFARVYEYSKLCLLLFSYELHRQLNLTDRTCQVSVIAADPGAVRTNIMREVPLCLSYLAFIALKLLGLLQCPENGVTSILDAALAPLDLCTCGDNCGLLMQQRELLDCIFMAAKVGLSSLLLCPTDVNLQRDFGKIRMICF
ncbi:hypothetical protein Ancab_028874 [Ancistrocladus abbreviatus]